MAKVSDVPSLVQLIEIAAQKSNANTGTDLLVAQSYWTGVKDVLGIIAPDVLADAQKIYDKAGGQ